MRILFLLLCLTTFLSAAVSPMQLVIKTTSDNESFTLGLIPGETYNATIDWGDTTSEPLASSTSPSHIYALAAQYTITITGADTSSFPGVRFNGVNPTKVYELKQWGNHTWTTMNNAFNGCTNMTITATDEATAVTGSVTDFSYAFTDCSSLTNFPLINTSAGIDFSFTWAFCSKLTSFPLIDTGSGTTFSATWGACQKITSFPLIDTSAATTLSNTWNGCYALTSFPAISTGMCQNFNSSWSTCVSLSSFPLIDTSAGTNFTSTWNNCSGLTTFPQIDTGAGTLFLYTWNNCSNLTSFPLINTSSGTDFTQTWSGCSKITSFPLIDTSVGTTFLATWSGCSGLTTFPQINTSAGQSFKETWKNCSNLTSFPLIDTSLGTTFNNAWYNCTSLTSFPAINTSSGTNFNQAWENCAGIENFPQLNLNKIFVGINCFKNVTIPTTTYNALLIELATNSVNSSVVFHGGNSRYNGAAITARDDTLVTTKGWTITDGGLTTPIITSSIAANGEVSVPFFYQITASDGPTSFSASGLPLGLTVDTGTGVISGSPGITAVGVTSVTLSATNTYGTGPGKTLTIAIANPGAPVITSSGTATAVKGQAFSYQIVATNTPTSYAAIGLPANGLSINTSTGEITGTPTTIGSLDIVLQAINGPGSGVKQLTITVTNPAGSSGGGAPSGGSSSSCGVGGGLATFALFAFGLLLFRGLRPRAPTDFVVVWICR